MTVTSVQMEIPIVKSLLKSILVDNCFVSGCIQGIGGLISIRGLSGVEGRGADPSHEKDTYPVVA